MISFFSVLLSPLYALYPVLALKKQLQISILLVLRWFSLLLKLTCSSVLQQSHVLFMEDTNQKQHAK